MIRPLLITLTASAALMAADDAWTIDVRGHVGGSSPMNETDGADLDGKLSLAWGLDAAFRKQPWDKFGFALLAGVFRDIHRGEKDSVDLDYTALGINLAGGVTYQVTEPIHLEGLIHGRFGSGRLDGTDANGGSVSGDHGSTSAFGITAGGYYTFPFRLMIGANVGWESWKGESDVSGTSIDNKGDGLVFSAVAGYVF